MPHIVLRVIDLLPRAVLAQLHLLNVLHQSLDGYQPTAICVTLLEEQSVDGLLVVGASPIPLLLLPFIGGCLMVHNIDHLCIRNTLITSVFTIH